jgi:peptidoglycan-associated lipoprotein
VTDGPIDANAAFGGRFPAGRRLECAHTTGGDQMGKFCVVVCVSALSLGGSACASKKFVRGSVGATNDKVNSMIGTLEETQARTKRNERRIAEVDAKTDAASQAAYAARGMATDASGAAKAAGARIEAIDKGAKKLVYDVALTADEANFTFGGAELPMDARVRIDGLIHELIDDPKNCFIEIEGHTDDVGSHEANVQVGLARARAVQRYLYEVHDIPLHKMNVISYGEDKPADSNKTEAGRAHNRRVVIRIRT